MDSVNDEGIRDWLESGNFLPFFILRAFPSASRFHVFICSNVRCIRCMTKKENVMKLVDESTGLMECLVCGAKHTAVMKPGADGKYLPENWECVNKCTLIHHDEKSSKKR